MLQFLINSFNFFRFQNLNTPVMEGIIDLHNYIFFYLIMIFIFICYWLIYIVVVYYIVPTFFYDFNFSLTVVKVLGFSVYIICFIYLLLLDDVTEAGIVFDVIGHKWFIHYEYSKIPITAYKKGFQAVFYMDRVLRDGLLVDHFDYYLMNQNDWKTFLLCTNTNEILLPNNVEIRIHVLDSTNTYNVCKLRSNIGIEFLGHVTNEGRVIKSSELGFYGQYSDLCNPKLKIEDAFVIRAIPLEAFMQLLQTQESRAFVEWSNLCDLCLKPSVSQESNIINSDTFFWFNLGYGYLEWYIRIFMDYYWQLLFKFALNRVVNILNRRFFGVFNSLFPSPSINIIKKSTSKTPPIDPSDSLD